MFDAVRSLGIACGGTASFLAAQENATPAAALTIDAIFAEQQFKLEPFAGHWQADSQGFELIRKDPVTGAASIARISLTTPQAEETSVRGDSVHPLFKVGTTNPAARIGVIDLGTLATTWAKNSPDFRENYLPRLEWVDSGQLAIQHLNRRQNQCELCLVDAGTGSSKTVLMVQDSAWIDIYDETIWLKDNSQFLSAIAAVGCMMRRER